MWFDNTVFLSDLYIKYGRCFHKENDGEVHEHYRIFKDQRLV